MSAYFQAFDMFRLSEQHHHILKTHFRLALDTFCFPLSDTQFQDITSKFIQPSDAIINYDEFLKHYGNNDHQEVATIEKYLKL